MTTPGSVRVVAVGVTPVTLFAAHEFARYGIPVTIIREEHDTHRIYAGPQADPDGTLERWIREIGAPLQHGHEPSCVPVTWDAAPEWVKHDEWVRVPAHTVFGIPSSPLATDVNHALGTRGSLRAYLDRLMPVLTIGKTRYVAELVQHRLGRQTLRVLVEPIVRHLFGAPSSEVEVAQLAPGLNEAETRAGSLSGAVLAYLDRAERLAWGVEPDVGWDAFFRLVEERLTHYGAGWCRAESTAEVESYLRDADVVILSEHRESEPLRTEVHLTHGRPEWWPGGETLGRATQVLDGEWAGWSARTSMLTQARGVTEVRSPRSQGQVPDPDTLPERLFLPPNEGVDRVGVSVITGPGIPLEESDTTSEGDAVSETGPWRVQAREYVTERGLARSLLAIESQCIQIRRHLLGLTS